MALDEVALEEVEGSIMNGRDQKLHTYAYLPSETNSVLVFHHGFGEYSGRQGMPEVFRAWARSGVAVHTFDAHGHGRSEPLEEENRHLIWSFDHIVDDLIAFADTVRKQYDEQTPMFLGGHSMGALSSIIVALKNQSIWDGLVLGTATVDVEWNWTLRLQASVGSLLAMLIPRAKIVPASASDSPEQLQTKVAADPLLCSTNVRARTANELLRAFAHVQQFGHLLWLPIYCHHGTADRLASIAAVRRLLGRCASNSITFHEVAEGPHELFLGSDSETVTDYVLTWIQQQLKSSSLPTLTDSPLARSASLISLTGNPFDWTPTGGSQIGSVYGGSPPLGCSPLGSPRRQGSAASPFTGQPAFLEPPVLREA